MRSSGRLKETGRLALDTNAIIAFRSGNKAIFRYIDEADTLLIPVTVLGELLYGAMNSSKIEKNMEINHRFVEYADIIDINYSIAHRYSVIRSDLKKRGRPIPENDIWIAASCIELDVPLVTRDSHFSSVYDLKLVQWDE